MDENNSEKKLSSSLNLPFTKGIKGTALGLDWYKGLRKNRVALFWVLRYNSIPFTKINKSIKIKYAKIVIISQDHRNTKIEQIKTIFNIKNEI